jgi:DNA-binding response OmpR family regulator
MTKGCVYCNSPCLGKDKVLKMGSETIAFVVDDEKVIADTLAVILRIQGFASFSFANPFEALEAAGRRAPDLLISDVMMPQLSGIELAIRIKEMCPSCMILLFSGQAATQELLIAAREQGHHFELLAKPVHPSDLLERIRTQTVLRLGSNASLELVP